MSNLRYSTTGVDNVRIHWFAVFLAACGFSGLLQVPCSHGFEPQHLFVEWRLGSLSVQLDRPGEQSLTWSWCSASAAVKSSPLGKACTWPTFFWILFHGLLVLRGRACWCCDTGINVPVFPEVPGHARPRLGSILGPSEAEERRQWWSRRSLALPLLYAVQQTLSFLPCTDTVSGVAGHNRGRVVERRLLARTQGRTANRTFNFPPLSAVAVWL